MNLHATMQMAKAINGVIGGVNLRDQDYDVLVAYHEITQAFTSDFYAEIIRRHDAHIRALQEIAVLSDAEADTAAVTAQQALRRRS